jgi:hypothetical protein
VNLLRDGRDRVFDDDDEDEKLEAEALDPSKLHKMISPL